MKLKSLFCFAVGALVLASCGGEPQKTSSSEVTPASTQEAVSSAAPAEESMGSVVGPTEESSIVDAKTNDEVYDYESMKVNLPTNKLVDDFAYGADLSIVAEIEKNGGVYFNEEGKEQDIFRILANDGVNYCRLRLWNDPKSALTGLPYGGGDNDLATDIALAKRAKEAGMKVLLDFHYSDSWADPQKQRLPKAWEDNLVFEYPDLIGEFTKNSLQAFKNAGIVIDSCQIGNETNNMIASVPMSEHEIIHDMVESGVNAAKEVFPSIKTLVHLTNIKSPKGVYNFLNNVKDVPFDVVGLSYYPYWHGTQANLLNVMNKIKADYDRPVWIVETAYGVSNEQSEYCQNQYHSSTYETPGGYVTGTQGQATMVADVVDTLSKVNGQAGQGIFWWEPAWLPVQGSTWASKAGQYYNDTGRDGTEEEIAKYTDKSCLPSWCNQGWFSYTGKALPSASIYKHLQKGDRTATEVEVDIRDSELEVNVNLVDKAVKLPQTAAVVTNLDALRQKAIEWNQAEIDKILATGDGDYEVHGKVGEFDILAKVTAETNYVKDYSFENQPSGEEAAVTAPWVADCSLAKGVWIESKSQGNLDGDKYFHWYNVSDFTFTLQQTLEDVRAGDYDLSTRIMAGDLPSDYSKFEMWYQFEGGEKVSVDVLNDVVKGWGDPLSRYMQRGVIEHIIVPNDGAKVTIGMTAEVNGSGWGHNDLWSFAKHKEAVVEEEYVANGALEDGNLASQKLWGTLSDPWILDGSTAKELMIDNTDADVMKDSGCDRYLRYYGESAFTIQFHQNIRGLDAGLYNFTFNIVVSAFTAADGYDLFECYFQVEGEEERTVSLEPFVTGWADHPTLAKVEGIEAKEGKKLTVGIRINAKGGAWGRMTNFALVSQ